jgi:hypothetical protein
MVVALLPIPRKAEMGTRGQAPGGVSPRGEGPLTDGDEASIQLEIRGAPGVQRVRTGGLHVAYPCPRDAAVQRIRRGYGCWLSLYGSFCATSRVRLHMSERRVLKL